MIRASRCIVQAPTSVGVFGLHQRRFASSERIFNAGEDDFDNLVLSSDLPVIVDFYADWCRPCRDLGPKLDALVEKQKGVKLAKVDVDESNALASKYNVQSIPRVLAFYKGEEVSDFTGLLPDQELENFVENLAIVGEEGGLPPDYQ